MPQIFLHRGLGQVWCTASFMARCNTTSPFIPPFQTMLLTIPRIAPYPIKI